MASPLDDIAKPIGEIGSSLASGIGIFVIFAIIIAVAFVGIIFLFYLRRRFGFLGTGHQLGHYFLLLTGKYPLEVNLAEWNEVDDTDLDLLEKSEEKDFEVYADVIRQMKKEGNIFIYSAKVTDDSEVQDELGRRTYIISSADLDDKKNYFESQKAKFTWRSFFEREKTKYVSTFEPVDIIPVYNEDKNEDDWIFITPVPREKPKTNIIGFDSRAVTKHTYYIEPKQITNADKLAPASSYMPFVIKTKKEYEQLLQENKALEDYVNELSADVQSKQQIIQNKNRKLGGKEWIIISKKERIRDIQINMMWVIVGVILGSIMPNIMRSYIANETTAFFVGIVVAMAALGFAYKVTHGRKKEKDDDEVVTEEVSR